MNKTYLGDSVFAEIDRGMIKLTTNNGYPDDPRNVIYLEAEVYAALREWVRLIEMSAVLFKLCKKVSDPPGETKGEWKSAECCSCGVALRATVKILEKARNLIPVCCDCAAQGPEYVLKRIGSCANVSQMKGKATE